MTKRKQLDGVLFGSPRHARCSCSLSVRPNNQARGGVDSHMGLLRVLIRCDPPALTTRLPVVDPPSPALQAACTAHSRGFGGLDDARNAPVI